MSTLDICIHLNKYKIHVIYNNNLLNLLYITLFLYRLKKLITIINNLINGLEKNGTYYLQHQ